MIYFVAAAVGYTTVAGSVASWFFSVPGDRKKPPVFVAAKSFIRTILYHSGSLLLGALLVAIVRFVRTIYRKARSHMMRLTTGNIAAWPLRVLLKVVGCVMWVMEVRH